MPPAADHGASAADAATVAAAAAVPLPAEPADPWQQAGQDPWGPHQQLETDEVVVTGQGLEETGSPQTVDPDIAMPEVSNGHSTTGQPVSYGPSPSVQGTPMAQTGMSQQGSTHPMAPSPQVPPGLMAVHPANPVMTHMPPPAMTQQGVMHVGPCPCQGMGWTGFPMGANGLQPPPTVFPGYGLCVGPHMAHGGFPGHPPAPCVGPPPHTIPWSTFPWAWPQPPHVASPNPITGTQATAGHTVPTPAPVPTSTETSWSKPASVHEVPKTGGMPPPPDLDDDEPEDNTSSAPTSEIRSMLRQRLKRDGDGHQRPKSSLGSVRIEEFWGDRARYVKWKRTIQAQQCLYGLESQELSMLVYLSTKREARDVVEQHPVTSYTGPGGLQLLWKVLDEAFGESEAELFERADKELERYRRAPGESIAHYLAEMRRLRAQYSRIQPRGP